jgi:hypothetical protein
MRSERKNPRAALQSDESRNIGILDAVNDERLCANVCFWHIPEITSAANDDRLRFNSRR